MEEVNSLNLHDPYAIPAKSATHRAPCRKEEERDNELESSNDRMCPSLQHLTHSHML